MKTLRLYLSQRGPRRQTFLTLNVAALSGLMHTVNATIFQDISYDPMASKRGGVVFIRGKRIAVCSSRVRYGEFGGRFGVNSQNANICGIHKLIKSHCSLVS